MIQEEELPGVLDRSTELFPSDGEEEPAFLLDLDTLCILSDTELSQMEPVQEQEQEQE